MISRSEMLIKVCGMKKEDNIRMAVSLGPSLMGFIFYRKSPRYAGGLDPEVVKSLPESVSPVAVFVDAAEEEIEEVCNRYGISIIQLHGAESPEMCRRMRDKGFTVFKAVGIHPDFDWKELEAYRGCVDIFLFDTHCAAHGGSGRKFDWSLLRDYPLNVPYLLSGGIGPDDTDTIKGAMRPGMVGIDINSGFETEPGVKDCKRLQEFISKFASSI